mmetsp:Transcript_26036/g.36727  ORF Transcript_26036/g.36727 Transcript_26036/m.36727 type:complete len:174 (-) Transcript_26036:263-784(-)
MTLPSSDIEKSNVESPSSSSSSKAMLLEEKEHGAADAAAIGGGVKPPVAERMSDRPRDPFLTQTEAYEYASSLPFERRRIQSGCYVIRCVYRDKCDCPVSCVYNCACGDYLWMGLGTIPFGCFMVDLFFRNEHYHNQCKNDTIIVKVDESKETLACYSNNVPPGPCCYCEKQC